MLLDPFGPGSVYGNCTFGEIIIITGVPRSVHGVFLNDWSISFERILRSHQRLYYHTNSSSMFPGLPSKQMCLCGCANINYV